MTEKRQQLRQSAVLVAGTGTTAVLTLAFMVICGWRLGAEAVADLYAGIFLLFAVHTVFMPVNTAVARFAAVTAVDGGLQSVRALHRGVFGRVRTIAAVLAVVGVAASPWIAPAMGMDSVLLAIAWVAALLIGLASIDRGVMRGTQSFGPLAGNMVAEATVRVVVGLAAVFAIGRADVAMAAYLVGIVAAWPHLRGWLARQSSAAPPAVPSGFWPFVVPLLALAVADAGFQNYDVLFVKRSFPNADAGAYGAAATLSRGLGVAVTPFVIQVVPLLADRDARKRSTSGAMARLVGAFLFLSVGAMLVFAAAGDLLVETLFGHDFEAAADVLVPHALGSLAGYLGMVLAQGLAALARFWFIGAYVAGFVAEVVLLHAVGDTPVAVAVCALVVKLVVLGLTAVAWLTRPRREGTAA